MLKFFILLITCIHGFVPNPLGYCEFPNKYPVINFKFNNLYDNKDIFNFEVINNNDIRKNIGLSLKSWNNNHPNLNLNTNNIGINTTFFVNSLDDSTLALANRKCNENIFTGFSITINSNKCFYLNDSICLINKIPYNIIIFGLLLILIMTVVSYFYIYNDSNLHFPVHILLIIETLLLFGNFIFCFKCHSFKNTITHEIGHILGLGHVDTKMNLWNKNSFDTIIKYKCHDRNNNLEYINAYDKNSIMMSNLKPYQYIYCISKDDVNGINYLYRSCHQITSNIYCNERDSLFQSIYFIILFVNYLIIIFIIIINYFYINIYS